MSKSADRLAAIVAVGAVMPDAANVAAFWRNILDGKSSIREVPSDRWNASFYYDPDPRAPDKTYSKIGGWVRDFEWNPLAWKLPIPPRVSAAMDLTQRLAIAAARETLADYGKPLDGESTAVILGNAMGGDAHLLSAARILLPEFNEELVAATSFRQLPAEVQKAVLSEMMQGVRRRIPDITEDTMPGELSNIAAGRIAALYDFKGPNFITDAACASAMAAMTAAVQGLVEKNYDAVLTGGVDSNMSPSGFVKFSKIGALSATGSRPYAEGADGFVMGEGVACFLLKRLSDAERDGDHVYAVIRGIGSSSDGKGKGITAPNPVGQRLAVMRGWQNAGVKPEAGDLIEGHGTSTKVGDVVEVNSLSEVLLSSNVPAQSIALGSVKSNIGHLKGAAGAVGVLKATLALKHKLIPPSINFQKPNPDIDFPRSPFYVNTQVREWVKNGSSDGVRRAGVSSFGFGGTNFHVVLEQHVPGLHRNVVVPVEAELEPVAKPPLRGALVVGGNSEGEIAVRLRHIAAKAAEGEAPAGGAPAKLDLGAPVRVAIDYANATELAELAMRAVEALEARDEGRWKALRNKGVYLGRGKPGKVAFLFTGQGSQYVNMLRELSTVEPIVKRTYDEADKIMQPLIGSGITQHIFLDKSDEAALARAEDALKQTAITQPAVLTVETALARLMGAYGITPDFVMGHSLGEYGALIAAGALTFGDALRAVSARGQAMTHLSLEDNGTMAAVFGSPERVQEVLATVKGYVVVANLNSTKECVIGGATDAMLAAIDALKAANIRVQQLSVSHAFHTDIVAPAAEPLREVLRSLDVRAPRTRIVANVTGEFYPDLNGDARDRVVDMLGRQVGSPVQFVKGLNTLYEAGARVFVEVGPKRALFGLVEDVLGDKSDVTALYTNHPRLGDVVSLNRALCGLYALGLGTGNGSGSGTGSAAVAASAGPVPSTVPVPVPLPRPGPEDRYLALGKLFTEFLDKSYSIYSGGPQPPKQQVRVGITGAAVGLPGTERVFDDHNIARIFAGEQLIKPISDALRQSMATRGIVRLVKAADGAARFEVIDDTEHVIKLAAKAGEFDFAREYGYPEDRIAALDRVTMLAIAAGIDALRDAGIPLIQRYKTTTTGSRLPVGWSLPASMRDDTGIIFASAFPGLNNFAEIIRRYYEHHQRTERLADLRSLRNSVAFTDTRVLEELDERIAELEQDIRDNPYHFDRRFLFQVLNMGHSQFAEYIGARGPNVGTNGACASGAQAVAMAKDWIEAGRCRRVIVISADDVTSDELFPWFGSGFLASGVGATDARVEDAAVPFDRRRHGMIVGMGGAAMVVETLDSAEERGLQPICEVLGTVVGNSAYHGSRLDVEHIVGVMEQLISGVEQQWQITRSEIANDGVFVSHETYTPARGGSASAEVFALRKVFGSDAGKLIVANTKGFTGHPMATGIEDALAVKMLETGVIPPVPNYREVDPELGTLNLSRGGQHPVQYAVRLGAGFGSQIAMTVYRWLPAPDGARRLPTQLGYQHRIKDQAAWQRFLREISGNTTPELELVHRTLRVKNGFDLTASPPVQAAPVVVEPAPVVEAAGFNPDEAVASKIIEIVSKQTGYPADMLALDLDLEADLGIDTVKQAEMFAAIRSEYNIERDENIALRDYPTLQHAIEFVYSKRPELRTEVRPKAAPAPTPAPARVQTAPAVFAAPAARRPTENEVAQKIIEIVAKQTGYPADMLALDLDLEADLGIDTVKQAEMFAAIRTEYDIERDENIALRDYPTLAHAIEFVYAKRPDLRVGAAPAGDSIEEASAAQPEAGLNAEAAVAGTIIAIVAKQTGYPADMLALDLDLEADLGIDTVKQAEMFAAIRAEYGIERDENIALRDYPTLKHAIQFVFEKRPDLKAGALAGAVAAQDSATVAAVHDPQTQIKRRVPVAQLRPPCNFFAATGVSLKQGSRVLVVPDARGVAKALAGKLQQLGVEVLHAPDGKIDGVYWLPGLDGSSHEQLVDGGKRKKIIDARVKQLYGTARALYDQPHFLISATRLGGDHGYGNGACDEVSGAIAGFTKAFAREKPDAVVKAVDFASDAKPQDVAEALIAETLFDGGVVEVGYRDGLRTQVSLAEQPLEPSELQLGADSVFVVTGAAGSITSAIVADLAQATHGTFWLLDLTPEPDASDRDLQRVKTNRDGLKKELFARLQKVVERATPAMVEKEIARLERGRAALDAISAVRSAGGKVQYRSVDLRDAAAVRAVTGEIITAHPRVDVLIHAAGLEISRSLPDKKPEEFDLVFDVKTEGWFNVIGGLEARPIGAIVAFSSIAGRFGNAGQTDYSAANDLLCKSLSAFHQAHPETQAIAIDWTAWADIGMASRGSIPTIMKAAGIDMLPPSVGVPAVRRELASGRSGEVVVAGALGAMLRERGEGGVQAQNAPAILADANVGFGLYDGLSVKVELDPRREPFLFDHQINGVPVLPGVMALELMAEAATLPFADRFVSAFSDVDFLAPFKFYRGEARSLKVVVQFTAQEGAIAAACKLIGERILHGKAEPEVTLHFTANVTLAKKAPRSKKRTAPPPAEQVVSATDIYRVYFHGPSYQVLESAWRSNGNLVGSFKADLPSDHAAEQSPLLIGPRLIELAFQTAGLAEMSQAERMGLPYHIDRLELYTNTPELRAGAMASVVVPEGENGFEIEVCDPSGKLLMVLKGYRTATLSKPVDVSAFAILK